MNRTGSQYGQAGSPPNSQFYYANQAGPRLSTNISQRINSQPQFPPQGTSFEQWDNQTHGGCGGMPHFEPSHEHLLSDVPVPDSTTLGQYDDIQRLIRPGDEEPLRIDNTSIQRAHLPSYYVLPQLRPGAARSDPVPDDNYAATLSDSYVSHDHAYDSAFASQPPTALIEQTTFGPPQNTNDYFTAQDNSHVPYQNPSFTQRPRGRSVRSESHLQTQVPSSARGNKRKRTPYVEPCSYKDCIYQPKNASEAKKHENTHLKPHKCEVAGCPHSLEGFGTPNDLERHRNGVHGLIPLKGPNYGFVCIECMRIGDDKSDKWWPRKDNFKNHICRKHISKGLTLENRQQLVKHIINSSKRLISQRPHDSTTDRGSVYSAGGNSGYMSRQPSHAGFDQAGQCYPIQESGAPDSDPLLPTFMPQSSSQQGDYLPDSGLTSSYGLGLPDIDPEILNDLTLQPRGSGGGFYGADGGGQQRQKQQQQHQQQQQGLGLLSDMTDTMPSYDPSSYQSFNEAPAPKRPRLSITDHDTFNHISINTQQSTSNGWDIQTRQAALPYIPPPPKGSVDGKFLCPWRGCNKAKSRECDLTKHLKRHTRPYGCTFPACSKRFGSRNDWKRHESSQHAHRHEEQWLCLCHGPGSQGCKKLAPSEESVRKHVQADHRSQTGWVKLGAAGRENYWCGFCESVVAVEAPQAGGIPEAVDAWEVRAKHIGDHYDHDGFFGADWWCLERGGRKGGSRGESDNGSKGTDGGDGGGGDRAEDSDLGDDGIPAHWDRGKRRRAAVGGGVVGDDVVMGNSQGLGDKMMYDAL